MVESTPNLEEIGSTKPSSELSSTKDGTSEKKPSSDTPPVEVVAEESTKDTRVAFNPGWKFYCLFGVLSCCTLVSALDANIVAVALPVSFPSSLWYFDSTVSSQYSSDYLTRPQRHSS